MRIGQRASDSFRGKLGALAAFGALAASTSFATADEISGAGEWVEVGVVAALLVLAVASMRPRWSSLRIWAAAGVGVVAATFSAVPSGQAFWYGNSSGLAEIACNGGSAAEALGLRIGTPVVSDAADPLS